MELRELNADPLSVCLIQFFKVHANPPALEGSVHGGTLLRVRDKKVRDQDPGYPSIDN